MSILAVADGVSRRTRADAGLGHATINVRSVHVIDTRWIAVAIAEVGASD